VSRPRIGLVGFGRWGRNILRDLRALACPVSVVVRGDRGPAREAGAATTVSSIEELRGVDGAVVSTPTSTHAEVTERVREVLGHGCPARWRPMIIRWIWLVPSTIWRALASRM
jgi:prephenate dehydrogenase